MGSLTTGHPLRAAVLGAMAFGVFGVAWLYRFNDPGGSLAYLTDDHFFYLVRGWQILFGELPVRDFVDHGAPLYFYVAAAVQAVDRGTLSELVFSVTVLAACAAVVLLIAERASGSLVAALVAVSFHVLLAPRFYNYPKILVYAVAIPALWAFADRPDARRAAQLAAVTVVAFLLRHDHGVFVAIGFATLVVLLPSVSGRTRVRQTLIYGALVLVLLAPYVAFISINGGVGQYFRAAVAWAQRDRARAEVVWPGLFDNPDGVSADAESGGPIARPLAIVRDNAVAWAYYAELALPFAALIVLCCSPMAFRPTWPNARAKIGAVVMLSAVLNAFFLRQPLAARLADPSVPHAVLIAWLLTALVALVSRRELLWPALQAPGVRTTARVAGAIFAVPVIGVLLVTAAKDAYDRFDKANLVDGPRRAFERMDHIWGAVAASFPGAVATSTDPDSTITLARYVRDCTAPDDRVFMAHYLPQVIGLAERGFAGGHADLRPDFFTSDEMQRLTVERLSRQSVPLVFVGPGDTWGGFRPSFPLVVAYFDDHYRPAGEREIGGFDVQLLVRNDRQPVRRFEPFGWPCYR